MVVESAVGVFDQVVEQVDRHDEECDYHECDERAGTEVDAGLRVVDFVAAAGFEGIFLWDVLGEREDSGRSCVRASRRYAGIWVSVSLLMISLGGEHYAHSGKEMACVGPAENDR